METSNEFVRKTRTAAAAISLVFVEGKENGGPTYVLTT